MTELGTRAGTCSSFVGSPDENCKVCGKQEYEHDHALGEEMGIGLQNPDDKKLHLSQVRPSAGMIQGGEEMELWGRNFSPHAHAKGHVWACFGPYKVEVVFESPQKLTCRSPLVPLDVMGVDEFETIKTSNGFSYSLKVRVTNDNGVSFSNTQMFELKRDLSDEGHKLNYSSSMYWGGLPPIEKKKPKKGEVLVYDKFLDTRSRYHPHSKYCLQYGMLQLMLMLHYATCNIFPRVSFEKIKVALRTVTATYPYTLEKRRDKMEKYGLFKDVTTMLLEEMDAEKPGAVTKTNTDATPSNTTLINSWLQDGSFSEFLAEILDKLTWEEQAVRAIAITQTVAIPHSVVLMENGLIEIQSFSVPSNYSMEYINNAGMLDPQEVEKDGDRYCRQWYIEDDIKLLLTPIFESKEDKEVLLQKLTTENVIEKLKSLLPTLKLAFDKEQVDKSNAGWLFSQVPGQLKMRMKMSMVACGMQHFCAVSSVVYGQRLWTWGDNGAGQLGRSTSSSGTIPAEIPGPVTLSTSHADSKIELLPNIFRVDTVQCGPLYTICAATSTLTGVTHIFSFGQPNERSLDRIKRGLPHKVAGLQEPSEVLVLAQSDDILGDLKAAVGLQTRDWKFGTPMTVAGKCLQFFPLNLYNWYESTYEEWSFFQREKLKEFTFGDIYEHRKPPVLGRTPIPTHFSYERCQHDEIYALYTEAIEEVDMLLDSINGSIDDYLEIYKLTDSAKLAPPESDLIDVQRYVNDDLAQADNEDLYDDDDDDDEIKLVFGSAISSRFVGLVTPGKRVKMKGDPSWFGLLNEVNELEALKIRKMNVVMREEMDYNNKYEEYQLLVTTLDAVDESVAHARKKAGQYETAMPQRGDLNAMDTIQQLTKRMSFFSREEYVTAMHKSLALQRVISIAKDVEKHSLPSDTEQFEKKLTRRASSYLKSPLAKADNLEIDGIKKSRIPSAYELSKVLQNLPLDKLSSLSEHIQSEAMKLKRVLYAQKKMMRDIRSEYDGICDALDLRRELQKDWILTEILEFSDTLPTAEVTQFRQAYRSGRSDFELAISRAEGLWNKLCHRMPDNIIEMYHDNLGRLRELYKGEQMGPIKDVLRNLDNIYVDEHANLSYHDFIQFSDMELSKVVDDLQDIARFDEYLKKDEGLKLVKIIQENAEQRLRINLLQQLRQKRLQDLQTGTLISFVADSSTVLHKYHLFNADNEHIGKREVSDASDDQSSDNDDET